MFAFIVTPEVPLDNPHLKLMNLMKRFCEILFSSAVSENDLILLDSLIKGHHQVFFTLYPPTQAGQQAAQVAEQGEGDEAEWGIGIEEVDDPQDEEEENEELLEQPHNPPRNQQRKKKPKKIRPINKHHQLLHYAEMIRKYGAAFLLLKSHHNIFKKFKR